MGKSKVLVQQVVIVAVTATISGCRHRVQTIDLDPFLGTPVQATKEGDTLRWRLLPGGTDKDFYVHFYEGGPCGPNKTIHGQHGIATCKVVKPAVGPTSYKYYIDNSPEEKTFIGPRSCGGCIVQTGLLPGSKSGSNIHGPGTTEVLFEDPIISCKSNVLAISRGTEPGSAIYWRRDSSVGNWTVTFPTLPKPPCTNAGPYTNSNPVCYFMEPRDPSYKYTISADNCGTNEFTSPNIQ